MKAAVEALDATLATHVTRFSIDMEGWFRDADQRFRKANRGMLRDINRETIAVHKRDLQLRYIRASRDPRIEQVRELDRIARAANRSQRIEQIEIEPGQYVAKRVVDCTRRELRILARQYDRRAESMIRRASFYRRIEQQLELAGMDDGQSMQDWLRQRQQGPAGTAG